MLHMIDMAPNPMCTADINLDDIMTGKHFTHYWRFVRGFPYKGQAYGRLRCSLWLARASWKSSRVPGALRHHDACVTSLYWNKQSEHARKAVKCPGIEPWLKLPHNNCYRSFRSDSFNYFSVLLGRFLGAVCDTEGGYINQILSY